MRAAENILRWIRENNWRQKLKEVKETGTHCQLIHPQHLVWELPESVSCMVGAKRMKGKKQLSHPFLSLQNEVELGELLLSLNYLPSAGRLNVDIIRAKQLLQTDVSQGSGTLSSLPPPNSFKRTSVFVGGDPIFLHPVSSC